MTAQFDGLFMTGVQQAQGIDNFFDNLFGFFARKTDFYTEEEKAYTIVNKYLNKHIGAFKDDKKKQEALKVAKAKATEKAQAEQAAKVAAMAAAHDSGVAEVTEEEAAIIEAQEAAKKANPAAATAVAEDAAAAEENKAEGEEGKAEEEKGQVPNSGNGGSTDKYSWTQELAEVTVNIPIPEGTTSKMLTVDI